MYLASQLRTLSSEMSLAEFRWRGLLLAMELAQRVGEKVVQAALERGLLINAPRPSCLRFMPALNIDRREIDTMIPILKEAISCCSDN